MGPRTGPNGPQVGPSGPRRAPPFRVFDRSRDTAETWDGTAARARSGPGGPQRPTRGGLGKRAPPCSEHPAQKSTTTLANIGRGTLMLPRPQIRLQVFNPSNRYLP